MGGIAPRAGVAQSVEQLSCKQQVGGSNPLASSKRLPSPKFCSWATFSARLDIRFMLQSIL